MIISHSKEFIFIHNYKVAGMSISFALSKYNNPSFRASKKIDKVKLLLKIYPNEYSSKFQRHIKAHELKERIPKTIFKRYFKFGFVRNPWDWQVSLYTYMLATKDHPQHKTIKNLKDFDEYIDWRVNYDLNFQKQFFYDDEDHCLVDFIGRFENMSSDFNSICNHIKIVSNLPQINKSRFDNNHFLEYYTKKTIDLVYEAFLPDIVLFNYKKPDLK